MLYVLAVLGSLDYGYFVIAELDRQHKHRTWVIGNKNSKQPINSTAVK